MMAVALDGKAVSLIAVADRIRATSKQAIAELQAMGIQRVLRSLFLWEMHHGYKG